MNTKHKLSDMTGYEPRDVMIVEREEYEAFKALNTELLAALEEIAELPSVRQDEASVIARAAINKNKGC